ncbi:MAG: HDOD domain-containing protein [Thermodesulfobacteriota bacterium]
MEKRSVDDIVATIEKIPTLPESSGGVLAALNDEDVRIERVSRLIESDLALTAQILKVANSPFSGTISTVSSVSHAIVILGLGEVKSLLLVFAVQKFFAESESEQFHRKRLWNHSIISGHIARFLARHFQCENDDTLFLSALIHDVGKIVTDEYFHEEFRRIISYVETNNSTFSKAEKEILGVTHYQIGAKLLQQWSFPRQVIMQVFHHHTPWQEQNFFKGAMITYLANIFAKLAGYPCLAQEKTIDIDQFAKSKAVDIINKNGFELDHDIIDKLLVQIQEILALEGNIDNLL